MMHAAERRWSESRMRENCTSGSMRGCRKRTLRNAPVFYSTCPPEKTAFRPIFPKHYEQFLLSTFRGEYHGAICLETLHPGHPVANLWFIAQIHCSISPAWYLY